MTARVRALGGTLWLSLLLFGQAGLAHQGPNAATTVFLRDGDLLGGGTTWGIVLKDGTQWLRVCEEAFGEAPTFHARLADGRILLGGIGGLFETKDKGCSYALVEPALDGQHVSSFSLASAVPDVAALTTSNAVGDSGVWLSGDGGQSFAPSSVSYNNIVFDAVRLDASGSFFFATGYNASAAASVVAFSDDRGETHTTVEMPEYARVRLLAIDGDEAVASALRVNGGSALLRLSMDLAVVSESEPFLRTVSAYVRVGDDEYISMNDNEVWVSRDGAPFEEIVGAPSNCLVSSPVGPPLWACGQLRHLAYFFSLNEDGAFDAHAGFGEVVERTCPAGTPGAEFCVYNLPDAGVVVGDDAGVARDGGRPDPGDGGDDCGCATGIDGASGGALVALAALCRRRRRARRPQL